MRSMAPLHPARASRAPGGPATWWRHLPALVLATTFLLPLWFMVSGSLRRPGGPPPVVPELLPADPSGESYRRAFGLVDLDRQLLNSLFVVAVAVPLTVVFASWAGFAISRISRRAAGRLVALSLVALMVPATALIVSRFAIFRTLRVTDTWIPLIVPSLMGTSPFYVLLYYWSFRRLPGELFEACRLEGMSPFEQWRRVGMPLVRPVTVAVGVLAFVFTWSNFLDPLIYVFDRRLYTLPLGLRSLALLDPSNHPMLLAGAVVATVPVVVAFLSVQRLFLAEHRRRGWFGG
jgi:multiple sugar transport system permease protein